MTHKRKRSGVADSKQNAFKFIKAHDPERICSAFRDGQLSASQAIDMLGKIGSAGAHLRTAELHLDSAGLRSSITESSVHLAKAKDHFEHAIVTEKQAKGRLGHIAASASLQLVQLPLRAAIAATGRLPKPDVLQRVYEQTVETSMNIVDTFNTMRRGNSNTHDVLATAGLLSEASVLLLGQRFAQTQNSDWLALLSDYSQDHANTEKTRRNRAWDVSVLTDYDQGIDTAYRIQVKASQRAEANHSRAGDIDGIVRVRVNPDLVVRSEKLTVSTIVEECQQEMSNGSTTGHLDTRTDKLLDVIDPPIQLDEDVLDLTEISVS